MKNTPRILLSNALLLSLLLAPLARAVTEPRTPESAVTPVEKSRHSDFMRQIKAGNGDFGFVLLGDSITDGWPGKGKETFAQFAPWKPLIWVLAVKRLKRCSAHHEWGTRWLPCQGGDDHDRHQ